MGKGVQSFRPQTLLRFTLAQFYTGQPPLRSPPPGRLCHFTARANAVKRCYRPRRSALHKTPQITDFTPGPEQSRALRAAFGRFATGVTVVSCAAEGGPVCMTANSFSSLSLDPPLLSWAVATRSQRAPAFCAAAHFAVHVLGAEQEDLAHAAARDGAAFTQMPHARNAEQVPVLEGCLARFDCATEAQHPAGDHTLIIGRVLRAQMREGGGLVFFNGQLGPLGAD